MHQNRLAYRSGVAWIASTVRATRRSRIHSVSSSSTQRPCQTAWVHTTASHSTANSTNHINSASSSSSFASSSSPFPASSPSSADSSISPWTSFHAANHVSLSPAQKGLLFVGSSIMAMLNPHRGDLVAAVGEIAPLTTLSLKRLHSIMLDSEDGRHLLDTKPRINSTTWNLDDIRRTYAPNTLGYAYVDFMSSRHYNPDGRTGVRFVSDTELAYVLQRYREIHDILHVLTQAPTTVVGELAQKSFEGLHFQLPMAMLSSSLAVPFTLSTTDKTIYYDRAVPWAEKLHQSLKQKGVQLINVRFEQLLQRDLNEVRQELGIIPLDLKVFQQ